LQIALADLGLHELDAARCDGIALFVGHGERPLQGLAGLCDWRLCGALSRVVRSGFFQGTLGEVLLMPGGRRIPSARVFIFGAGDHVGVAGKALLRKAFEVCKRAGVKTLGFSLESLPLEADEKPRVFLELARHSGLSGFVLLGEAKRLQRSLEPLLASGEHWVPLLPPGPPPRPGQPSAVEA
jgi:hypothetical protein